MIQGVCVCAEEPEIKLPIFDGSWRKQRSSRNIYTSASLTRLKPLIVWITTVKILKEMEETDHLICFLRNLYAGQETTVEPDTEQWTGSKLGKEYIKAVYCHLAYLTYKQSTS